MKTFRDAFMSAIASYEALGERVDDISADYAAEVGKFSVNGYAKAFGKDQHGTWEEFYSDDQPRDDDGKWSGGGGGGGSRASGSRSGSRPVGSAGGERERNRSETEPGSARSPSQARMDRENKTKKGVSIRVAKDIKGKMASADEEIAKYRTSPPNEDAVKRTVRESKLARAEGTRSRLAAESIKADMRVEYEKTHNPGATDAQIAAAFDWDKRRAGTGRPK